MEDAKTLLAIILIITVFMVNYLYGVWITRHSNKASKTADPQGSNTEKALGSMEQHIA